MCCAIKNPFCILKAVFVICSDLFFDREPDLELILPCGDTKNIDGLVSLGNDLVGESFIKITCSKMFCIVTDLNPH